MLVSISFIKSPLQRKGTKTPKNELGHIKKAEIFNGLYGLSNKYATLWLFCVELYRRSLDRKYDIAALNYTYSLEHIMPQKWEEYWNSVEFVDDKGAKITDIERGKINRISKIYSLGNMTLIRSRLNSSIRNYPLKRKIEGEGRKRGLSSYAELTITKHDIIDKYSQGAIWNEKTIFDRTNTLVDEIMKCYTARFDKFGNQIDYTFRRIEFTLTFALLQSKVRKEVFVHPTHYILLFIFCKLNFVYLVK